MGDEQAAGPADRTPRRARFVGIPESAAALLAPICLILLGVLMVVTVFFDQPAMFAVAGVAMIAAGGASKFALVKGSRAELPAGIACVVLLVLSLVLFARAAG